MCTLFAWSKRSFASQCDGRQDNLRHPFMLIVTGAFGAGKTSIVSFLLDHTMGLFGWEEHDYSEHVEMRSRTRCKALEVIESILVAKQPDRESVKLHVIDNASFIQSTMTPDATLRLTQLMQSYK